MKSIDFFVPVIYSERNKTRAQQVLEAVDEYLYLGNKACVTIFPSDGEHPQSWAIENREDCHRSRINTTLKVASYCTIILPLIALSTKALLRRCLQVSSIQVEEPFVLSSRIRVGPPVEALERIGLFTSYENRACLGQSVVHVATSNTEQYYIDLMEPLKAEIKKLFLSPSRDAVQRLLVDLINSPAFGDPKHWTPVIDDLMEYLGPYYTVDEIIEKHAKIAELLATSEKPISPDQIYRFCQYLGQEKLSNFMPWVGFRALEQYLLRPQLNLTSVSKAIKEYLNERAKAIIVGKNQTRLLYHRRKLEIQEISIDPRDWFGLKGEKNSLWNQSPDENDRTAPMPALLLEVLWTHIQSLRASCQDKPCWVIMEGRAEAQLPYNFTLTLAQYITNAEIFLNHNHTIDIEEIKKQQYARIYFRDEEIEAEAEEHYPSALGVRDRVLSPEH